MSDRRARRRKAYLRACYAAQHSLCGICGHVMAAPRRWPRLAVAKRPNLEHVWPTSRGGTDTLWNQVAAHHDCNVAKADRLPYPCEVIFLEAVRARLNPKPPAGAALKAAQRRAARAS